MRALLLWAALAAPLAAYQREDHNATVRLVLGGGEDAALAAICAQLPDEAPELSAIDVYKRLMTHPLDYARWVLAKSGPPETVGRMVAVQRLQHALTGGRAEAVSQAARRVVADAYAALGAKPDPDRLCALGFAWHLYGDSFAHRRMSNPERMYDTGIGHLFDYATPDLPLSSTQRLELWRRYISSAAALVPGRRPKDHSALLAKAGEPGSTASGSNGYNQAALRSLVAAELGGEKPLAGFDRSLAPKGCQALLDRVLADNGIRKTPSCERTWALFRASAIRELGTDPNVPYLMGSPFDKGPKW